LIHPTYPQSIGLALAPIARYGVTFHGFSARRMNRESGEIPELPRSGKQVRKPTASQTTLEPTLWEVKGK
jgi:hypothetical protein